MTAVIAGTEKLSSNVWLIGNDSTAEAAKAVPSTEGKRVCTVYGKNPRVLNSAMNANDIPAPPAGHTHRVNKQRFRRACQLSGCVMAM